jgi:hypothetical protein
VNKLRELWIEEANREDEGKNPSARTSETSALAGEDVRPHEPFPEPSPEQQTLELTPAPLLTLSTGKPNSHRSVK